MAASDAPFSPPTLFVCTYEVELTNLGAPHSELISRLVPQGAVKALNCNFGHSAQPGYERFLKKPRPSPVEGWAPRTGRPGGLAPALVRQRKHQGDGSCFNSAIEAVLIFDRPEDGPVPPNVSALLSAHPNKHYAVKSFPTTGKTQVPGVLDKDLADGAYVARAWAEYLSGQRAGLDPQLPVEVKNERPIMQNFKFHLRQEDARVVLNLSRIVRWLEAQKGGGGLPYPIRELKHAQDNTNISFKFQLPSGGDKRGKRVRVNLFYRGKVNILGAASPVSAQKIHAFLSAAVLAHPQTFLARPPLPDPAPSRRDDLAESRAAAPEVPETAAARPLQHPRLEEPHKEGVEEH